MEILKQITEGIQRGQQEFASIMDGMEIASAEPSFNSRLSLTDNVEMMRHLISGGYKGSLKTIYIDPPFFTKSKFNAAVSITGSDGAKHRVRHLAFDDRFNRNLGYYIENMTVRLLMMRELLADDGTIWIHLDWHSSHYIRLVLDELMGEKNFVNEIIWCYKSGGSGKKHFSRKHDTILVYSKTPKYYINIPQEKSYNRGFKPYNFKGVKEYSDEQGWYTLVNMKDVWNVDMVGRTSSERNGYATQKPLELMRRIIEAGSKPGDMVGDFFCGSGSFLEAAERSGRKWIGCDNERLAFSMARKRLTEAGADFSSDRIVLSGTEGRVDVTVRESETLENGGRLLKLEVTDFVPEIDTGYIQKNDRIYVENVLREDPVQLIDYLIIGYDRSEGFEYHTIIRDVSGEFIIIAKEPVRIIIVDVFGREYDGGVI